MSKVGLGFATVVRVGLDGLRVLGWRGLGGGG